MISKVLAVLASLMLVLGASSAWGQTKTIRWGTSSVGSVGHRVVTQLAEVLSREMPDYQFVVQPTPGAILTVKGYATGQFEAFYGANIAFYELANDINRFEGFKGQMKREPVQSFWTYTTDMGLSVHTRDKGKYKQWRDLIDKRVFTGPRPWDTRAQLERAFRALGMKYNYTEVGIAQAGSLLESGRLDAMLIYTSAQATTPPWLAEATLQTEWTALNPSAAEIELLKKAGVAAVQVDANLFRNKSVGVDKVTLLPFYYGFHVGMDMSEQDVYRLLKIVEKRLNDLVKADKGFAQLAQDMVGMQRQGVESAIDLVPVHPGLAKFMREKGAWDAKWDSRIAKK